MKSGKNSEKFIFNLLMALATAGIIFLAYLSSELFSVKRELREIQNTPRYAQQYLVSTASCSYLEKICTKISFNFTPSEKALNQIPEYEITEFPEQAKTEIIFHNVGEVKNQFDYKEVVSNPLVAELDDRKTDGDFLVTVIRKGAFLPAKVIAYGTTAVIFLPEGGKDFPSFSGQRPANDSSVYAAPRRIGVRVTLKDPLKEALLFLNDQPVEFSTTEIGPNYYSLEFTEDLSKNKDYKVRAVVKDQGNRTSVAIWEFDTQIPPEDSVLGEDRFKYLGWWGKINSDGVSVREDASSKSKKLGSFSSANRVKVLKEVEGELIDNNNLWYKIDGGKYPGAYVFSQYVTPIEQPEPPQDFSVPEEVSQGEYWVDVDLTKKIITLFAYNKSIFTSYVSPGREENSTVTGTFRVWYKLREAEMKGGPPLHSYQYDLKDVPHVLYYEDSYAIHGTYWHDKFGTQQSAGCTNLTQGDAAFVFDKVNPELPPEQKAVFSSKINPGTVVHNHY